MRAPRAPKSNPSPRNRTLQLSASERYHLRAELAASHRRLLAAGSMPADAVLHGDFLNLAGCIEPESIDLLFVDPPYNLTKQFNARVFHRRSLSDYADWLHDWLARVIPALKPTASVYVCGDWRSSSAIHQVCADYFTVRNRITFEREKGRGARHDWKNSSEDIWFCTLGSDYHFDADAVKLKKRVIAPYRLDGAARDWAEEADGRYRLTHPSNLWTDITMPFWSMPENTPHPTQKPEKLLAKIILASSRPGDRVLDPFAGSGTTGVVARKLDREFQMIELDEEYCLYALKRLRTAAHGGFIQGYSDGVFWERNSAPRPAALNQHSGADAPRPRKQASAFRQALNKLRIVWKTCPAGWATPAANSSASTPSPTFARPFAL